jgi:hypothetical protein
MLQLAFLKSLNSKQSVESGNTNTGFLSFFGMTYKTTTTDILNAYENTKVI